MLDWFMHSVGAQLGVAGVAIVICGVVAWYVPPLRKLALTIAGIVFAGSALYAKGASDAKRKADEKRREDEARAIQRGHDARADAERDVANGVSDGWNRDK